MRKVIIVDDESLVRVGLQSLFDWENYGYSITGAYQNGKEALAAIKSFLPDIDVLLTDIRMPDMNGLELIKEVKRIRPELNIVILSSYNDFEYMRKAIQYGVKDYVLKHKIEQKELLKVLNSLKYSEDSIQPDYSDPVQTGKDCLIKLIFEEGISENVSGAYEEFDGSKAFLNSHDCFGVWVTIRETGKEANYRVPGNKALPLLVEEIFKRLHFTEFLGVDDHYINGIIYFNEFLQDDVMKKTVTDVLDEVLESVKDKLGISLKLSVSKAGEANTITGLIQLRKSAGKALQKSFYDEGPVYFDTPEFNLRTASENERDIFVKGIKEFIIAGDIDSLYKWMSEICKKADFMMEPQEFIRLNRYCIHQLIDNIMEKSSDEQPSVRQSLERLWSLSDIFDRVDNYKSLMEIMSNMFVEIRQLVGNNSTTRWIQTVKKYIMENYWKTIHLEDVARMVNFSENYFSQRFKQETKCSFAEFLTNTRIQKAMELFKKTELTTEEISFKVGYNNPNYFIKVFKKITGKTISDFKKYLKN